MKADFDRQILAYAARTAAVIEKTQAITMGAISISDRGTVPIKDSSDVVRCRQTARQVSERIGFSLLGQTMIMTAASELARNTLIYGGGGELHWSALIRGTKVGLQLTFTDNGPGIPNLNEALTAGWTSGRGMGLGLTGAKRLTHEFEIDSRIGIGTRVSITRWK